jgi:ribosomal protein S18 acetylase RimI-like enzyme
MPTVELASSTDGQSIMEITAAVGIFTLTELSCVAELWNAYLNSGEDSGYIFLVYRDDDGRTLGYVCFGPHALTQGTNDLYWIAVAPDAHGRGIGHALLAQAEAEVRTRGGRLMLVETSDTPPYASARHLYETSGYGREATVHDFYAPGDSLLIFAKQLGRGAAP